MGSSRHQQEPCAPPPPGRPPGHEPCVRPADGTRATEQRAQLFPFEKIGMGIWYSKAFSGVEAVPVMTAYLEWGETAG